MLILKFILSDGHFAYLTKKLIIAKFSKQYYKKTTIL